MVFWLHRELQKDQSITTHREQQVSKSLLLSESFSPRGRSPGMEDFFKPPKQSRRGESLQVPQQNVILQQPKNPDEVKEKLHFQAEGEARRLKKKWRQNTPLANELSCLVGELVSDTTKEKKYLKLQQIKTDYSIKFISRMGSIPVICKNTYGNVEEVLAFYLTWSVNFLVNHTCTPRTDLLSPSCLPAAPPHAELVNMLRAQTLLTRHCFSQASDFCFTANTFTCQRPSSHLA